MTLLLPGSPGKARQHPCAPPARPHSLLGIQGYPQAVEADPKMGNGALWQCDECGRYWRTEVSIGAAWWYPISDRKARRILRRHESEGAD